MKFVALGLLSVLALTGCDNNTSDKFAQLQADCSKQGLTIGSMELSTHIWGGGLITGDTVSVRCSLPVLDLPDDGTSTTKKSK